MAVYAILGLLAALENVVPPLPTDVAVALGAFLSQRGVTNPVTVFIVVWICNVAGAVAVYAIVRRHSEWLLDTRAGRALFSPAALAGLERTYLRFGLPGIVLARFLPGARAAVAPFAGLANLTPARAIIPMAAASALWYGLLTWIGATLGLEWPRIEALLQRMNQGFLIVAIVAALALGIWLFVRHRRRRRNEPADDVAP